MSPDPASPESFGRSPAAAARAAVVLAVLGGAAALALERFVARPGTPLGDAFAASGIPPMVPALFGLGVVIALAVTGYLKAVRTGDRFRITEDGLEVEGSLGRYVLQWSNIEEAAAAAGGALGIRVRDRDAVLATHQGSEQQREWLRTMDRYGDWDFLYPAADLGLPAETVLARLRPHLQERR